MEMMTQCWSKESYNLTRIRRRRILREVNCSAVDQIENIIEIKIDRK